MKENIPTSTIKVPKKVLENIKIYCRKRGKPVGEWVETTWNFIEKNDFDIYDDEATPCLPIPEEQTKKDNQVEVLCKLMSEFIIAQKSELLPTKEKAKATEEYIKTREEKVKAETEAAHLKEENLRLRNEIKELQEYKKKAHEELCRVRDEQPTIGKIKVNTEF